MYLAKQQKRKNPKRTINQDKLSHDTTSIKQIT